MHTPLSWVARSRVASTGLLLACMALFAISLPRWWCGRPAAPYWRGESAALLPLARYVAARVRGGVSTADFRTGSPRFDGEWAFGTYLMGGLGLLQLSEQHPALRDELMPVVDQAILQLLRPELRAFDSEAWGEDALAALAGERGHAAYLGYLNLLLGARRLADASAPHAELHGQISAALARRFSASAHGLIQTYPGEAYPVDNAAGIASLALFGRAVDDRYTALVADWLARAPARYLDPASGLLVQAVEASSGAWRDAPRASGTALAAYFLSFADRDLSGRLLGALESSCATRWLGFGLIREYPPAGPSGRGDIDSGPVLFGMSFSGTGFAIGPARIHGRAQLYADLYRTAHLIGAPIEQHGERHFLTGGALGNAILLAMLTAGGAR